MRHSLATSLAIGAFAFGSVRAGEFEDSVVSMLQESGAQVQSLEYDYYRSPASFQKTAKGWAVSSHQQPLAQQIGSEIVRGHVHLSLATPHYLLTEATAQKASPDDSQRFLYDSRTFASSSKGLTIVSERTILDSLPNTLFWPKSLLTGMATSDEVRRVAEIRKKADISKVITAGSTFINEYSDRAAIGLVPPFVMTLNEYPIPISDFLSRSRDLKLLKVQTTPAGQWDIIAETGAATDPSYMFRILWDPKHGRILSGRRGGCKRCASIAFDDWLTHDEFDYEYEGTDVIPSSVKLVHYEEDRKHPVEVGETRQGTLWLLGNRKMNPPETASSYTAIIPHKTEVRDFIQKAIYPQGEDPKHDLKSVERFMRFTNLSETAMPTAKSAAPWFLVPGNQSATRSVYRCLVDEFETPAKSGTDENR